VVHPTNTALNQAPLHLEFQSARPSCKKSAGGEFAKLACDRTMSRIVTELFDNQIGKKTHTLRVPQWVSERADQHFIQGHPSAMVGRPRGCSTPILPCMESDLP